MKSTKRNTWSRETLLRAVVLYYEKKMTQEEVSNELGVSRPQVSVMLSQAREDGLVHFSVKDINKEIIEYEIALKEKYKLNKVRVVSTRFDRTKEAIKSQIGELAANYLKEQFSKVNSIGIGWGSSSSYFVNEVDYMRVDNPKKIVPLVGGLSLLNDRIHSNYLASSLATKLDSEYSIFYAPVIAESEEEASNLCESRMVRSALEAAQNVDIAFIGVGGSVSQSTWKKFNYIKDSEIEELENAGAVGDVVSDFFDENGNTVTTSFSKRLIGISIEDLQNIKDVVLMADGIEKANNTKLMLEKKVVNTLIVDDVIARNILGK